MNYHIVINLILRYLNICFYYRWTILCWCWLSTAGLKWTVERLQGVSSFLHMAAWGLPAAQTVAVLVRRDVDADELTGIRNKLHTYFSLKNIYGHF